MPNRIGRKDVRPEHMKEFKIPIDPRTGRRADLVGIRQGKQVIGFFITEQESITSEVRTSRGWKYYSIPEGAHYILFDVTPDQHPSAKVSDKIITVAEFRDANNQKIVTSRVESK